MRELDFSIEYAAEDIYNPKSKEYFGEVIQSYYNGSYRSAVVMLYSIVICDLVYKLQDLTEQYRDETAKSILEDIKGMQESNPKSPEWEWKLVEMVRDRTSLLDGVECQNIENLRNHRHFSAHPVLDEDYILFKPNKETVRSHIRNMLEDVLLKPPILSKKITEEFVNDLSRVKDLLPQDEDLARYLAVKYFKNLNSEVESRLFKSLWKFVFKLTNAECNENREINIRAMKLLFRRRTSFFSELIQSERQYFSDVEIGEPMEYLIGFLSEVPHIYNFLDDSARVLVERESKNSPDLYAISVFLSGNVEQHVANVQAFILSDDFRGFDKGYATIKHLYTMAVESGCESAALTLLIHFFGVSWSYNAADSRYETFIRPNLARFNRDQLLLLLDLIEDNTQLYRRGRAYDDNYEIKLRCDEVFQEGLDYNQYPHFLSTIRTRL